MSQLVIEPFETHAKPGREEEEQADEGDLTTPLMLYNGVDLYRDG
jgi:hypothetical protein